MRIQHNIAAMNSYRQLGTNNNALSKNLEKLSSGYRINRAGDDAAGLAISEKMRAQIKGLETASKNANDAISLVQTAEGALTEVHSMLNRMTELATQSANGTYEDAVDRENLQAEVTALKDEIDRISKATNFNGIKLLDGSLGSAGAISAGSALNVENAETVVESATTGLTNFKEGGGTANKAAQAAESYWALGDFQSTALANAAGEGTTSMTITFEDGNTLTVSFKADATAGGTTADVKKTFTAADIATALNNASGTGNTDITDTATVTDSTLTLSYSGTDWDDVADNYDFSFANGELKITAVNTGDDYGVTGVSFTASTTGTDAADMKTNLSAYLGANAPADIKIGDATQVAKAGIDAVAGGYQKSQMEFTVADQAAAHGTMIEIDGTKYILKDVNTDLEGDAANTGATVLSFDKTVANDPTDKNSAVGAVVDALKTAIAANGDLSGKVEVSAASTGSKIILTETNAHASNVLNTPATNASVTQEDYEGLVKAAEVKSAGDAGTQSLVVSDNLKENTVVTVNGKKYEFAKEEGGMTDGDAEFVQFTDGDAEANANALAAAIAANDAALSGATTTTADDGVIDLGVAADAAAVTFSEANAGLVLQIGDTAEDFNKVTVQVDAMDTKGLGIDDVDISTQSGAADAVEKIKAAINKVSSQRGDLGAIQNRLEHTINNLGVTTENITAAESRIRDTDMASEMMAYTKNNILIQASQAMLAQANQVPQGVLQLLQ